MDGTPVAPVADRLELERSKRLGQPGEWVALSAGGEVVEFVVVLGRRDDEETLTLVGGLLPGCHRLDGERDSLVVLRHEPDIVPSGFQPGLTQLPEDNLPDGGPAPLP